MGQKLTKIFPPKVVRLGSLSSRGKVRPNRPSKTRVFSSRGKLTGLDPIPGIAVWGRFQGIPGTVPNRYPRPLSRDRGFQPTPYPRDRGLDPIPGSWDRAPNRVPWTLQTRAPRTLVWSSKPGPREAGLELGLELQTELQTELPGPWFGPPNQGPGTLKSG